MSVNKEDSEEHSLMDELNEIDIDFSLSGLKKIREKN